MLSQFRFALSFFLPFSLLGSPIAAQTRAAGPMETISIRVSEGTNLGFDLSPDGRMIVFDLLGQLWLMPAQGGIARPITDAVRDTAEDLDPSFSPDGRRVVFRGERNGRTGLWLLSLDRSGAQPRQLTQLSNPDGYEGDAVWSADGRTIAFTRVSPPTAGKPPRSIVLLLDADSGTTRELSVTGIENAFLGSPGWVRNGREVSLLARDTKNKGRGRIWIVPASGGEAKAVTNESVQALGPALTPDSRLLAYFAPDNSGRTQVWVQKLSAAGATDGPAVQVTNHVDVTPTRIRWIADGRFLLYSADGRLWKVTAAGGPPTEVKFTAQLSLTRPRRTFPRARFPEAGVAEPARGFMGLALSPDASQIGVLALGKLWLTPVGGTPRAIAQVPFEATSLAWSSDGAEVAWSSGIADQADLFATNVATGVTRQITSIPGRELHPTYSPDGRHLAFVHATQGEGTLRVVDARANNAPLAQTRDLGQIGLSWTSPPQWSPESDGLLVSGEARPNQQGTFVPLSGQRQTVTRFPDAPIFLQWTAQQSIVFVRHDRLWHVPFARTGMLTEPQPLGTDAALYASSSRTGAVLFVSDGGLRLRFPDGRQQKLGWPISYTPPIADSTLIRNVRIVDGTGGPISGPSDILIERGRITQIAQAGKVSAASAQVIDAAGRVAIPGLMDLHSHTFEQDLLIGLTYYGVTTVRDQGSSMAPLVAYAEAFAARLLPGPRIGYGGFQFYSDWAFDEEQWRGIEPEADPDHIKRAVALAQAFGAQHIKTRTFRRWDINARMISEAHRLGMRSTGHCAHALPLVAAGIDAKEHFGACETRGNTYMYDDMVQLFRAAGIAVVPTISYLDFAVRLNERPALLDADAEVKPFLPARESFNWMLRLSPAVRKDLAEDAEHSREGAIKLLRAGITIGVGTDIWQVPTAVHMELEQLVAAGLTPAQAIHAGTGAAARILGAEKDLGTIEVGKWADLIVLDADPLTDIRNTRKIWRVMQSGWWVDRDAILKALRRN